MSRGAFSVALSDTPQRTEVARSLLENGEASVLLEDQVLMHSDGERLVCYVIDPFLDGPRSPERFENLIESGRALLSDSTLGSYAANRRLEWAVISDYGTGAVQLWPPP